MNLVRMLMYSLNFCYSVRVPVFTFYLYKCGLGGHLEMVISVTHFGDISAYMVDWQLALKTNHQYLYQVMSPIKLEICVYTAKSYISRRAVKNWLQSNLL